MNDDLPTLRRKMDVAKATRGHEERAREIAERIAELEAVA
jgi:hypothetical protein